MTPNEAAQLLAIAAAYDNRKPDATAAKAWALALADLRLEDCQQAIVQHYQTSAEWMMPVHVIAAVRKTRTSRLEDEAPSPPPGMDPDDTGSYARWLEVTRRAIADGREVSAEEYQPTRQIGELRMVLRAVPAIEAKPREKSAEHVEARRQAEAELAARPPVPVAGPLEDERVEVVRAALPKGPAMREDEAGVEDVCEGVQVISTTGVPPNFEPPSAVLIQPPAETEEAS